MADDTVLTEQLDYYRARALEYDKWWMREGRFDRGPEANTRWFAETTELERVLERFDPRGDVLELACGTGLWTRHLVESADTVTAVDAAPEVLAINRARVGDANVRYVQADLFDWSPDQRYDACVFAFWLSHVPAERFADFWEMVAGCLKPGGRVLFIDSARTERPPPPTTAALGRRGHHDAPAGRRARVPDHQALLRPRGVDGGAGGVGLERLGGCDA